jgi:hypothetical protein
VIIPCRNCPGGLVAPLWWEPDVWVHVRGGGQVLTTYCDGTGTQAQPTYEEETA